MHYLMGSEMGWAAVPFILVVGAAYMWLASLLVKPSAVARVAERETKTVKVAKAA